MVPSNSTKCDSSSLTMTTAHPHMAINNSTERSTSKYLLTSVRGNTNASVGNITDMVMEEFPSVIFYIVPVFIVIVGVVGNLLSICILRRKLFLQTECFCVSDRFGNCRPLHSDPFRVKSCIWGSFLSFVLFCI